MRKKRKSRIEEQNQVAFVTWFRLQYPQYKKLITIASFGENIGEKRMARLKQMGLTAGFPDIVIQVARFYREAWVAGLFIEMKTKKGKLSEAQKEIHSLLSNQYLVKVAHSFEEAQAIVADYFL